MYRVLDLSENTFNSSVTSFRHKSVGGYSPTKMQRYQDLIDQYLTKEINTFYAAASQAETLQGMQDAVGYMPVMSMLNTRYIIIGADYPPLVNEQAFGEAWLVKDLVKVNNADDEIAALGTLDLHSQAVVRADRVAADPQAPSYSDIVMTYYAPNEVQYAYTCDAPVAAVFSEIYHPSWKATLKYTDMDGNSHEGPLDLFQADWVLRGALLPAGEGEITMKYQPDDYRTGRIISTVCSLLMLLAMAIAAGYIYMSEKKRAA